MFSSITKKKIVATTGLMLIIYIIAHLAGNLWIYAGPEAFNDYGEHLAAFGPLLWAAEIGLLAVFFVHIWFTAQVVLENIKARGGLNRYAVQKDKGNISLAVRLMPYTGTYIFVFVVWHLFDFKYADVAYRYINGQNYGLYGVVVNAFKDPTHSALYIFAMCCLGLHLAHGTQSFMQTFGANDLKYAKAFKSISAWFALLIVVGYSSIPIYVLFFL